jgi:hypothetical protein
MSAVARFRGAAPIVDDVTVLVLQRRAWRWVTLGAVSASRKQPAATLTVSPCRRYPPRPLEPSHPYYRLTCSRRLHRAGRVAGDSRKPSPLSRGTRPNTPPDDSHRVLPGRQSSVNLIGLFNRHLIHREIIECRTVRTDSRNGRISFAACKIPIGAGELEKRFVPAGTPLESTPCGCAQSVARCRVPAPCLRRPAWW